MNKKVYEQLAEYMFAQFELARQALADKIREEVVLPACRKYKVTFTSGMGMFSFRDESEPSWLKRSILDAEDCRAAGKDGLVEVLDLLNMEVGEKFEIGHFVEDVTEEDLK